MSKLKNETKEKESHVITVRPGMKFGEPCIDDHRMRAEQVAGMWWNGETLEAFGAWNFLNRGAVLVCCWYMARYGSRTWRKRWKDWLLLADAELWEGHYDCPLPPQMNKGQND